MRLVGYQYSWFTKTQFLILLAILAVMISVWIHYMIVWNQHEMSLKVKTVTNTVTQTQYKDRTVNYCDKTTFMDKAHDMCSSNGVDQFSIDKDGKPVVKCK